MEFPGTTYAMWSNATNGFRNVPVIFLTSRGTPQDYKTGHELGAVIYMVKPLKAGKVGQHRANADSRDCLAGIFVEYFPMILHAS